MNANLKQIHELLKQGNMLRIGHGTLWTSEDNKYIHWQNFGQSANKNTLANLRWILKVILDIDKISSIEYKFVTSPYV